MKITVQVYRRPDKSLIHSRLVVGAALGDASEFSHGKPAWGFAERGIIIVCTPEWEPAVGKFLAGQHEGEEVSAANEASSSVAHGARPRGSRTPCRARKAAT